MIKLKVEKIEFIDLLTGIALILTIFLAGEFRVLGFVGFALLITVNLLVLFKNNWKLNLNSKLNISIILNIVFLVIHMFISIITQRIYNNTFYSFLMQIMIYVYLLILVGQNKSYQRVRKIAQVYSLFFISILVFLYIKDLGMLEYSSFFEHQLGILLLPTTCFFILSRKNLKLSILIFLLSVGTIYLSTRRAPLLALLIFLVTYLLWQKILNSPKLYKTYFIGFIIACLIFPLIYMNLSQPSSLLGAELNSLSIKYTGSRFFSGRDNLWPYVFESIKENPLWGVGVGVSLSELHGISLSTHNLFLFVTLQTGVIGLLLFINMLYRFWLEYYKINTDYSRIFGPLLIAILVQQTFSLGLLAGKMALALPVWTLLAYGTYRGTKNSNEDFLCIENNYHVRGNKNVRNIKTTN